MERTYFEEAEARKKVGRRIRTLEKFSGVPEGTPGQVVGIYQVESKGFDVVIEWDLPMRQFGTESRLVQDWFTKDQYEKNLIEE
jgi:hypothetical protein